MSKDSAFGHDLWQSTQERYILCLVLVLFPCTFSTMIVYCVITPFGYNGLDHMTDMDVDDVFASSMSDTSDGTKSTKAITSKQIVDTGYLL